MIDSMPPVPSGSRDRIVVGTIRNTVTGGVEALVNPEADWSPRKVNDVIDDIVAGRHRYVLGPPTQPVELKVVRGKRRTYLRAASDLSPDNNLSTLPRYDPGSPVHTPSEGPDISRRRLVLARLPRLLSPDILKLGELPRAHRHAAQLGAAALIIACMLLLRPHDWGAWGGIEYVPQIIRYSRVGLIVIAICIALAAGVLAWGLAGHDRIWTLALVPLGLLAAATSGRIRGPVAEVLRTHGPLLAEGWPNDARIYLGALTLLSLFGMVSGVLIAILGVIYVFFEPPQRAGKVRLVPAIAISITFGLIVIAYAYSYLPSRRLSNLLTTPNPMTAAVVPMRFNQSMALELILMTGLLGFAVVVVNYWGASAWAQFLGEYASAFGNRFTWRGRALILLLFLGCAKLMWVIYGFANRLPEILGGSADYWYNGGVNPALSVAWAGLILTPVTFLAIRKIRRGIEDDQAVPRQGAVLRQGLATSLGIALVATYPSAAESGSYVLNELIPHVRTVNYESPLYMMHPTLSGTYAAATMSILGAAIFWRRKPGSAAVFAMAAAVLALNALHWLFAPVPFVGLATIDLIVSIAFTLTVAVGLIGRRELPGWAVAGWLAFTVLTHLSSFVPTHIQRTTFEFVLVATFAYTFLWRANELNALVRRRPNQIVIILGFSALLALVNLVGILGHDRYGRDFNRSIDLWLTTTDSSHLVAAPFLVLILMVAASGAIKPPRSVPDDGGQNA